MRGAVSRGTKGEGEAIPIRQGGGDCGHEDNGPTVTPMTADSQGESPTKHAVFIEGQGKISWCRFIFSDHRQGVRSFPGSAADSNPYRYDSPNHRGMKSKAHSPPTSVSGLLPGDCRSRDQPRINFPNRTERRSSAAGSAPERRCWA
jgi:hypothetical protein